MDNNSSGFEAANSAGPKPAAPLNLAICFAIILAIFAVYAQVIHYDFVNFDDETQVYQNPHIQAGLSLANVKWAFTSTVLANWMPLTLISHMVDVQLFGMNSGMHHLMNVCYHALASILLFLLLYRATGARACSAFVAFVFALHPLHVESVAWVAERKDVLSAVFFFLAIYAYIWHVERPSLHRYVLVVLAFCLGLMAKPMLVTLPFVLLLLDHWPLRREPSRQLIREKLPLFAISAVSCVVTFLVQRATGAVTEFMPAHVKLSKSFLSYAAYTFQTFWPAKLAVYYPYPRSISVWKLLAGGVLVAGVTAFVLALKRSRPYLATGWFWYIGMLVPVIGLVKIGDQARADRYTYLPMVGFSLMFAWGASDAVGRWPRLKPILAVVGAACCTVWCVMSRNQVAYWRNSETLFGHAIKVTSSNWLAEGNLGTYLLTIPERRAEAIDHVETAVRINPRYAQGHIALGVVLAQSGFCDAAIPQFALAERLNPRLAPVHTDLALCLAQTGHFDEALPEFQFAVRLQPDDPKVRFAFAEALSKVHGRELQAITQFKSSLQLDPNDAKAHQGLGELLLDLGQKQEAAAQLEAAEQLESENDANK